MLRIVHSSNSLPASFICDPSASFLPGTVAELAIIGNQVMATVSSGRAPLGLIDDVKTTAFTNISWNEVVIVPAVGVAGPGGKLVTPIDIKAELRRPNIIASSFLSTVHVYLNPVNGLVTFLAGTELNEDLTGSGTPNAIRAIVNYTYQVANIPGDDSTQGSGRVTVWYNRMFVQTDQYETNQQYPLTANLFVSEVGLLTTRKPSDIHPSIGFVTSPPSSISPLLELLFF